MQKHKQIHRNLTNICNPLFEKRFIYNNEVPVNIEDVARKAAKSAIQQIPENLKVVIEQAQKILGRGGQTMEVLRKNIGSRGAEAARDAIKSLGSNANEAAAKKVAQEAAQKVAQAEMQVFKNAAQEVIAKEAARIAAEAAARKAAQQAAGQFTRAASAQAPKVLPAVTNAIRGLLPAVGSAGIDAAGAGAASVGAEGAVAASGAAASTAAEGGAIATIAGGGSAEAATATSVLGAGALALSAIAAAAAWGAAGYEGYQLYKENSDGRMESKGTIQERAAQESARRYDPSSVDADFNAVEKQGNSRLGAISRLGRDSSSNLLSESRLYDMGLTKKVEQKNIGHGETSEQVVVSGERLAGTKERVQNLIRYSEGVRDRIKSVMEAAKDKSSPEYKEAQLTLDALEKSLAVAKQTVERDRAADPDGDEFKKAREATERAMFEKRKVNISDAIDRLLPTLATVEDPDKDNTIAGFNEIKSKLPGINTQSEFDQQIKPKLNELQNKTAEMLKNHESKKNKESSEEAEKQKKIIEDPNNRNMIRAQAKNIENQLRGLTGDARALEQAEIIKTAYDQSHAADIAKDTDAAVSKTKVLQECIARGRIYLEKKGVPLDEVSKNWSKSTGVDASIATEKKASETSPEGLNRQKEDMKNKLGQALKTLQSLHPDNEKDQTEIDATIVKLATAISKVNQVQTQKEMDDLMKEDLMKDVVRFSKPGTSPGTEISDGGAPAPAQPSSLSSAPNSPSSKKESKATKESKEAAEKAYVDKIQIALISAVNVFKGQFQSAGENISTSGKLADAIRNAVTSQGAMPKGFIETDLKVDGLDINIKKNESNAIVTMNDEQISAYVKNLMDKKNQEKQVQETAKTQEAVNSAVSGTNIEARSPEVTKNRINQSLTGQNLKDGTYTSGDITVTITKGQVADVKASERLLDTFSLENQRAWGRTVMEDRDTIKTSHEYTQAVIDRAVDTSDKMNRNIGYLTNHVNNSLSQAAQTATTKIVDGDYHAVFSYKNPDGTQLVKANIRIQKGKASFIIPQKKE